MDNDIARSKVPEVMLVFWIIKILATTLGEIGGDAASMSMNLGYAVSSFIFIGIFVIAVIAQIFAKRFHPFLYWLVVIATTIAGTTRRILPTGLSASVMPAAPRCYSLC